MVHSSACRLTMKYFQFSGRDGYFPSLDTGMKTKQPFSTERESLPKITIKSKRKKRASKEQNQSENDFYLPRIQAVPKNPAKIEEVLQRVYNDLTNSISKVESEQREEEIIRFVKERETLQAREERLALLKSRTYSDTVRREGKANPVSKSFQFSYFPPPTTLPPISMDEPRAGKRLPPYGELVDEENLDPKRLATLKKMDNFAKRHFNKVPDINQKKHDVT